MIDGNDGFERHVEESLYAARAEVERYLEANACFVRRGHAGAFVEPGNGFMGAVFLHRTSRLGDPGIHLHWTVFNVAQGPDGRRTALDARALYRERYTAEGIFQATLRRVLATRLGLVFDEMDRHGVAEVVGISSDMRRAFSRCRTEIVAEMERLGLRDQGVRPPRRERYAVGELESAARRVRPGRRARRSAGAGSRRGVGGTDRSLLARPGQAAHRRHALDRGQHRGPHHAQRRPLGPRAGPAAGRRGRDPRPLVRLLTDHANRATALAARQVLGWLHGQWSTDPRTTASVYATARNAVWPWADPAIAATADGCNITLDWLLADANTLYLTAPLGDETRIGIVFAVLLHDRITQAFDRYNRTGEVLDPRLLVLLDEAANTPLPKLPQWRRPSRVPASSS